MAETEKKTNKKVGLIGYWFATNYGGVASYYSLYRMIGSLGYDPFLIENPYFKTDKEGEDVFSRNFFRREGTKIAKPYDNEHLNELNGLSDIFVLGSDQVLTSSSIRAFGKLFLMDFAEEGKKCIAVSSSCGGDDMNVDGGLLSYASDRLRKFCGISVREFSAQKILEDKFGIEAEVLADPILFTSAAEYRELGKKSMQETEGNYILAYVLDPTEDKRKCIGALSDFLSLDVKIALDGRKFTHGSNLVKMNMPEKTLPELDFYQWLFYFDKASYIFTDSFHGAVMALIMNKPCIVYINKGRGLPRFVTLGKMFDVQSRMIENFNELTQDKVNEKIDFKMINEKIKNAVSAAKRWMKDVLLAKESKLVVKENKNLQKEMQAVEWLEKDRDFRNIRLLATLFRDYGVKHVVLSPGGRDVPIIRMFEYNADQFVLHRVTDERSAAYYGLGLAAQLRSPVACICTSGTAASNFLPAVTEAFYTGIPLIVVTADRYEMYLNHGEDQTIPQKKIYDGVVKMEISLPESSGWRADYQARRDISACILEATHNGFGPVHINVPVDNISVGANVDRKFWALSPFIYPHILRAGFNGGDSEMQRWVAALKKSEKILVVCGQAAPLSEKQKKAVEKFASSYNCVLVTDPISNLHCQYSLSPHNMLTAVSQEEFNRELAPDILISVGGKRLMNDPLTYKVRGGPGSIRHWSVTPDGKVKDFYFRLSSVIEATSDRFFEYFSENCGDIRNDGVYYEKWRSRTEKYKSPSVTQFNSLYVQSKFLPAIPANSLLHLGVGQTFIECRRFAIPASVEVYCNMGTNGIDGCTSTFMGQCAVENDRLCFLLVGDLSFFYDMNSIWNKPLKKNMRILLVNNNGTGLLRGHNLQAVSSVHNTVAEGWVRSTGFEYLSARTKEEFEEKLNYFLSDKPEKALFFEVLCQ